MGKEHNFENYISKCKKEIPGFNQDYELYNLGFYMRIAREQRGLSQTQLAEKAGLKQAQISRLENGFDCRVRTFLKVCIALDVSLDLVNN